MSHVSFSLRASSKRKRGRLDLPVSEDAHRSADLHGVFVSAEEAAVEAAGGDHNDSLHRHVKKALLLEDAVAKVKRLQGEGNTLAEAERFRAAMDRWQEALAIDKTNAVIYELMAQAAMALCDDFEAVQYALKAVEFAPRWGDAYLTLGRCHLNFGELELAKTNLEKALDLLGKSEEIISDLGEVERLLNEQVRILARKDVEARDAKDEDKLQVISCKKHLSLRGQVG